MEKRGKNVLGVQLAPLHVPWERRMQTLAVAYQSYSLFLHTLLFLSLLYVFSSVSFGYVPTIVVYLSFYLYDKDTCSQSGRRSEWFRNLKLWKNYCDYFPISLVKTAELDPSRNYLLGSHPHGIICNGAFGCFATEGRDFSKVFPNITPRLLMLDMLFSLPVHREALLATGSLSVSAKSMNYLLSRPANGNAYILVPGGAPESLDSHPGSEVKVHLSKRKGFVKMAIRHGVPLVPTFSFGETEVYDQLANPKGSTFRRVQDFFETKIGFAPVFVLGRGIWQYTFGLLPHRKPITVVVGAPIPVEKIEDPTQDAIDAVHKRYTEALVTLFNTHKAAYAGKDDAITIV